MRAKRAGNTKEKRFYEGRAVMAIAMTATVFLCLFTAFEVLTLKLEWNVPFVYAMVGGSDNYIFSQYRKEEEALEQSLHNVVESTEDTDAMAEAGQDVTADVMTGNSLEDKTDKFADEAQWEQDTTEVALSGNAMEETEEVTEIEEDPFPYYLKINRQQNVVTVYEKDENDEYTVPVKAILCSTGLYNATPKGVFQLSSKYVWRELNGGVYGQYASRITGGVLFHSVPYASKNKSTLYTAKYNKLGQQASMGCVRLTVEDAKWIYDNCPSGTYVEVYESEDPGPLGKPETIKIDSDNPNKGWDPTDPDANNPWHAWSEDE